MDLRFTPEEVAFRDEMRSFFRGNIPASTRERLGAGRHVGRDAWVESQQILNKAGLAVPHWPVQYGGRGWSPIQLFIYNEEMLKENVPAPLPFGTHMVGPVIIAFGTEEQKAHYLPRIANMDDWWCQGFSEPGAGSDLASLKTKAVRDGDHYVINTGRCERPAGRFRLGRHGGTGIFQLPQGVDLRRIERDTAQHHRQDGAGLLTLPTRRRRRGKGRE